VLQAQRHVNGLLGCYWKTSAYLSVDILATLVVLAEQLGIVVENHRLRQQAEEVAASLERQRLAQELHDAVAQTLYGLTMFARAGKDALERDDSVKLEHSLDYMEGNARQALKEMRLLLHQLGPPAMSGTADLADALNHRFAEVERRLGIQADIEVDAALPALETRQGEIYRIVVEALNNSLKHANASHVHVTVRSTDGGVQVTVRDNGSGFDATGTRAGMGLRSMRQRAGTLDGRLGINSRPGEGTEVCLWLPCNPAGEAA
jgi:signal transduction histidine kinase